MQLSSSTKTTAAAAAAAAITRRRTMGYAKKSFLPFFTLIIAVLVSMESSLTTESRPSMICFVSAFSSIIIPNRHQYRHITTSTNSPTTKLYAGFGKEDDTNKPSPNKKKAEAKPAPAQFEYQELRAQLSTMLNQKIRPNMLSTEKRTELDTYLTKILQYTPSPIQLKSLANNNAAALHGKWSLTFSSASATLGDLPRDVTINIVFKPKYQCEYQLTFDKILGLKSITAKSSYIVDSSPVNPGLVTMIYQDIVTDVFGFKNFPVGTFGLLKGRANYVESVWFDGLIWIERGYNMDGVEYFNVYLKNDDDDDEE